MPRGGRRTGRPGVAYASRTDLNQPSQRVRVATGQPYGQAGEQRAAQQAMPLPAGGPSAATGVVPSATPRRPAPGPPPPLPGQLSPLDAPTQRPNEPITAGLPVGPGAGPEALGPLGMGGEDVNMQLRAVYSMFPNEDIRRVLETIDTDDGSGLS